jgi:hypothetical protein
MYCLFITVRIVVTIVIGGGAKAPTPKYIGDFAFAFKIISTGYQRQRSFAFALKNL